MEAQPNGSAAGAHDLLANTKDTVVNTAQSTASSIQNSNTVQSISNGPVGQNARDQAAKTSDEFQNVANARTTPSKPATTGQPLTHYHSLFYNILSWQNPRATSITFGSIVTLIFAARYFNILHYFFKTGFMILATTVAVEVAGKTVFDSSLAARFRPRRYYTIPREALDRSMEDIEQLINFFCIETQRILFVDDIFYTLAVCAALLVSWGLIKIVPVWGLALIATTVLFTTPLVYIKNHEAIDKTLDEASSVVNQQATQLRDLTAHHTGKATASMRSYAGEYSSKAQQYMSRSSGSPLGPTKQEHTPKPSNVAGTSDPSHLPSPPVTEPKAATSLADAPTAPGAEPVHGQTPLVT